MSNESDIYWKNLALLKKYINVGRIPASELKLLEECTPTKMNKIYTIGKIFQKYNIILEEDE